MERRPWMRNICGGAKIEDTPEIWQQSPDGGFLKTFAGFHDFKAIRTERFYRRLELFENVTNWVKGPRSRFWEVEMTPTLFGEENSRSA